MSIWKWNHFSTFKKTTLIQWIKQTDYVISILFKTESSLILCYKYPSVGIAVIKKLSKSYCTEKTKVKVKYSRLPCLVFFFFLSFKISFSWCQIFSAEKYNISLFNKVLSRGKQKMNLANSHLVVRALL